MEPENYNQEASNVVQKSSLHQVTPLSKYLAMTLFIILPFVGGYVGYTFAPEKVVEVERVVVREVETKQTTATKERFHQGDNATFNENSALREMWNDQSKDVIYTHPIYGQQYFVVSPERGDYLPFTTYIFDLETDSVVELGPSPINKTSDISPDKSSYVSVSKDGKTLYLFDLLKQETITVVAEPNETFFAASSCELSHPSIEVEWTAKGVEYGVFSYPSVPDAGWCQTYDLIEMREL